MSVKSPGNGSVGPGGITGLANPSASVGETAINGSATTAMRSDAAPALAQPLNTAQGADIASATGAGTLNLETATGNIVDVTGTTTLTAITLSQGHWRIVRFTGALTLTHGASLVLPGGANILTVAGDYAIFAGYAAGVVRCMGYFRTVVPPTSGSFTGSLTGCTTVPTQTFLWARNGNVVTLTADAGLSATSNTTAATITGLPAALIPTRGQACVGRVTNNSATAFGVIRVDSDGNITLFPDAVGSAFTASGTKGILSCVITYSMT